MSFAKPDLTGMSPGHILQGAALGHLTSTGGWGLGISLSLPSPHTLTHTPYLGRTMNTSGMSCPLLSGNIGAYISKFKRENLRSFRLETRPQSGSVHSVPSLQPRSGSTACPSVSWESVLLRCPFAASRPVSNTRHRIEGSALQSGPWHWGCSHPRTRGSPQTWPRLGDMRVSCLATQR